MTVSWLTWAFSFAAFATLVRALFVPPEEALGPILLAFAIYFLVHVFVLPLRGAERGRDAVRR